MIPDPAPPFEFGCSAALSERIQRMLDRAHALGIGPQVEHSIAFIVDRIINDPRGWGDPVRNFRHAQLVEYHGRHADFLAVYAVHERIPIVFLMQLSPLPGNRLFGETL